MHKKIVLIVTGMVISILGALLLSGCSSLYDEASYQAPDWTPEGLIYFQKAITHYRKEPLGTITLGTDYEYWTMDTNGSHETKLPYNNYPYFSPKGTYAAFISGKTISIIRRSDNKEAYSLKIPTEKISWLSWGPDEDKLAYLNASSLYSGSIVILNLDGTNTIEVSSAEGVKPSWRSANKVAFLNNVNSKYFLAFINPSGGSLETTSISNETIGSYPQYYSDGNYIFSVGNSKFYKVAINSQNIASEVAHNLSSLTKTWTTPKLSPNDQKVVGGYSLESGIWIINIDGTGLKQLK